MGVPETLLSDQGANLSLSEIMQDLYKVLGIKKVRTTAYHPPCNGAQEVERRHKDMVNILKKLVGDSPNVWQDHLDIALFALNSAVCSSTGYSPYDLVFSYQVRLPADLVFSVTTTQHYQSGAHLRSENYYRFKDIFDKVRATIDTNMKLRKRTYDRQKNFIKYKVGDRVLVYRPVPAEVKEWRKFKNTFIGPFEIKKVISEHNYLVEHIDNKKELVVHFDTLRYLRTIQRETGIPAEKGSGHQSVKQEEIITNTEESVKIEEGLWSHMEEQEVIAKESKNSSPGERGLETILESEEIEPERGQNSGLYEYEQEEVQESPQEGEETNQSSEEEQNQDSDVEELALEEERQPEGSVQEAGQDEESNVSSGEDRNVDEEASRRSARAKRAPARFADEQNKYYGPK